MGSFVRSRPVILASFIFMICSASYSFGKSRAEAAPQAPAQAPVDPTIKILVDRLDLERYRSTVKALTQFGDRRQGTDRNRPAVDWIEAQLKSYGCTNTERIKYDYQPPPPRERADAWRSRGRRGPAPGENPVSSGGGRPRGMRARTGVNNDPMVQPDEKLRALDTPPSVPRRARRSLLHEDRHHSSGGNVHRRRPHGRHRLWRSGQ